jgi:hypothetical protein
MNSAWLKKLFPRYILRDPKHATSPLRRNNSLVYQLHAPVIAVVLAGALVIGT